MNCDEEKVLMYVDGELDEASARAMEEHFLDCPSCRELHARWTAVDRKMQEPAAPERWSEMRGAIVKRAQARPRWGIPAAVAASFLAAVVTVLAMRPPPPEAPLLVLTDDPEEVLVSGEVILNTVMEAEPGEFAVVCKAIRDQEAAEQLMTLEIANHGDAELADGFQAMRAVYLRLAQTEEEPQRWEVVEVQNALRESDVMDRLRRARGRIAERSAK
ncbi:MAG: anti-sigma factor family protein [Planctomycetota bacterium]|jgi:hypothetical protein